MIKQTAAQSRAHWKRGVVLCFLALFLSSALVCFSFQPVQAAFETRQDNQPAIIRVYSQVIDWTASAWQAIKNWIIEQGTHLARAFYFWSKEPIAQAPASAPKVLGEETSQPLPSSPLTYKTELTAPSFAKSAPASTFTPIETILPPASTSAEPPLPLLGKEGIPSEPATALVEQTPVAVPPAPAPESTPEFLPAPVVTPQPEEPARQNNPSYIPILARDFVPPTSKVSALATTTTNNVFTVSWTGEDTDATASPLVKNYDIQYQVDSNAWTDWILETTLLSSLFTTPLAIEKTYGFRSRARDRYGNLGTYPESADTSIYVNLVVPNNPAVTTPSNGSTLLSTTADEDPSTGNIVEVTLNGTGDANDIVTITLSQTATTATTTVSIMGTWTKRFALAEGANSFTLQSQEADGDQSSVANYNLTLEMVPTHDVVINEIAWMGTAASAFDEWIELYNASSTAISLADWALAAADGTPNITLTGTIGAKSYFLLERTSSTTVSNIAEDQIYTGALGDGGELLTLRQANGSLVDKAGSGAGWFAGNSGTDATMERKDPTGDGTLASNWASNDETLVNGKDSGGANLKGTPKSLNSQNTTIPRVVTNLQQQYIYTTTTSVRLYWTTPKTANLATTTPASYDLRYSTSLITESNFASATSVAVSLIPSISTGAVATTTVSGLATSTPYYFAIKTNNGVETSGLSNVATATTEDGNYTWQPGYPGSGVLSRANSPYLVTTDLSITSGQNLVIEPGTVVKMYGVRNIIVPANSSLIIATSTDAVNAAVITSRDDNTYGGTYTGNIGGFPIASDGAPAAGDWGNITTSAATSVVKLNHGIVAYGGSTGPMFTINAGTASVLNSILRNSSNYGMAISGPSTSLTMATSTVSSNLEGVGISTSADANITGSTFTGNHRGIAVGTSADEPNLFITRNNFFTNNAIAGATPFAGIHYSDTTGTLTAENNWWGSASGPTTSSPDGDDTRDAAVADTTAVIDYAPFATSAFTILPSGL